MTTATVADIELQRRLSGLSFAALSRRTGVPYQRLWRYFTSDGALSDEEMERIQAVFGGVTEAGSQDYTPSVSTATV